MSCVRERSGVVELEVLPKVRTWTQREREKIAQALRHNDKEDGN